MPEKEVLDFKPASRLEAAVGFEVLPPSAGIVERTFAWFSRFRRLARDFESENEDPAYR